MDSTDPEILFERIAKALPPKRVVAGGDKIAPAGRWTALKALLTGGFVTLGVDEGDAFTRGSTGGKRDGMMAHYNNIGLICALMLTVVIPMSYDYHNDWLSEEWLEASYVATALGEETMATLIPILNDVSLILYAIGSAGYFFSVIMTVLVLLILTVLSDDVSSCIYDQLSGIYGRMPYMFFGGGSLFMLASFIRWLFVIQTLGGLVASSAIGLSIGMFAFWVCIAYVRCCLQAGGYAQESSKPSLHLSQQEAEQDVEKWFETAPGGGTLESCLDGLAAVYPNRVDSRGLVMGFSEKNMANKNMVIGLDGISALRVAIEYHRQRARIAGLELSGADLYWGAHQDLQSLGYDSKCQEGGKVAGDAQGADGAGPLPCDM